jgi:dihydroorotase-like cyclic amidohydrolase
MRVKGLDTIVTGGQAVLPGQGLVRCGIGIKDGRIAALAQEFDASDADEQVDASGLVVVPGAVDSHYHMGIYRPLAEDAASETESSLVGGATTIVSYFRTGHHYLDKTGPYREIFPQLLAEVEGRCHTDYGFHIAPMDAGHVDEIPWLVEEAGVASFKYYFFYKGINLAADSTDAASYTMSDEYDFGHLYRIMEAVAAAGDDHPDARLSLSLHCEDAELIKLFMRRARELGLPPLEEYSKGRPPLAERLSIHEAGVLADATKVRINLLHLSSAEAVLACRQVRSLYPQLDIRLETTVHHLALTYGMLEGKGLGGKVNPPIRGEDDVEALWDAVRAGELQWVASDHACCMEDSKGDDLWPALPGFGGTALLYPVMVSEGYHRRGVALERIVDLVSTAPAKAYGCHPRKGSIAIGADADLALLDLDREQTVTPELLHSAQDHTPFNGIAVKGWPVRTMLRGRTVFLDGEVSGPASGEYLRRPVTAP